MNRRPPSSLPLSKAAAGFLQYKTAEGLSPNTLLRYQRFLRLWKEHTGDVPIHRIKTDDVRDFLIWLRNDYQPQRITGGTQPLASKTIHSTYMCVSAFFTWACREFNLPNPIKAIPAPKFEMAQIEPFSKEAAEALLKACEYAEEVRPVHGFISYAFAPTASSC
jgi:integrase